MSNLQETMNNLGKNAAVILIGIIVAIIYSGQQYVFGFVASHVNWALLVLCLLLTFVPLVPRRYLGIFFRQKTILRGDGVQIRDDEADEETEESANNSMNSLFTANNWNAILLTFFAILPALALAKLGYSWSGFHGGIFGFGLGCLLIMVMGVYLIWYIFPSNVVTVPAITQTITSVPLASSSCKPCNNKK
jgi:hypothetical protein